MMASVLAGALAVGVERKRANMVHFLLVQSMVGTWQGVVCPINLSARDRNEWYAKVADSCQHGVQRGLVDHRPCQQGVAVRLWGDGHGLEPPPPSRTQMPLDPDLIDHRLL